MNIADMFTASEKATITMPELTTLIEKSVRSEFLECMIRADVLLNQSQMVKILDARKEKKCQCQEK